MATSNRETLMKAIGRRVLAGTKMTSAMAMNVIRATPSNDSKLKMKRVRVGSPKNESANL